MEEKYKELIEAMLTDREAIDVIATVSYRDGSKAQLKSTVRVNVIG
jgi:hypothetical protein